MEHLKCEKVFSTEVSRGMNEMTYFSRPLALLSWEVTGIGCLSNADDGDSFY
jgi:hypothetical protein